eukprot:tig00020604_g11861.t1
MADAIASGVKDVVGCEVVVKRVPETLPPEVLEKMQASEAQKKLAHVPVATPLELPQYDAIIVGTPTRFGNMSQQMRAFWDSTASLWATGALVGKIGGVFVSSGTQHGGNEFTIFSVYSTLLHHGMVIAGLPYTFLEQQNNDSVHGCSPYGASTIAGGRADLKPTAIDLAGARYQGRYIAQMAHRMTLTKHLNLVFPQPPGVPAAAVAVATASATATISSPAPAISPAPPPPSAPGYAPSPNLVPYGSPAGYAPPAPSTAPPLSYYGAGAGGQTGAAAPAAPATQGGGDIYQKR